MKLHSGVTFCFPSLQFNKLSLAEMIVSFFGIATWKTNFDIVEVLHLSDHYTVESSLRCPQSSWEFAVSDSKQLGCPLSPWVSG